MSEQNVQQIGLAIYQILSEFDEVRRRVLRKVPSANQKKIYGLTVRQSAAMSHVMMLMSDHPHGISLKSLSERMSMHPSAASIMVDKMVNKGVLERADNPNDRRTICIRLSAKGQEIIANARKLMQDEMEILATKLTAEEMEQLRNIAAKLKENTPS